MWAIHVNFQHILLSYFPVSYDPVIGIAPSYVKPKSHVFHHISFHGYICSHIKPEGDVYKDNISGPKRFVSNFRPQNWRIQGSKFQVLQLSTVGHAVELELPYRIHFDFLLLTWTFLFRVGLFFWFQDLRKVSIDSGTVKQISKNYQQYDFEGFQFGFPIKFPNENCWQEDQVGALDQYSGCTVDASMFFWWTLGEVKNIQHMIGGMDAVHLL